MLKILNKKIKKYLNDQYKNLEIALQNQVNKIINSQTSSENDLVDFEELNRETNFENETNKFCHCIIL